MKRPAIFSALFVLFASFPLALSQSQGQPPQEPSLGELARKVRAKRAKEGTKPVKVYTNENIPAGPGGISVVGGSGAAANGGEPATGQYVSGATEKRGEEYYRRTMSKLKARLDTDQRELAVLQQKLNLNEVQYYPDPQKTLLQQYSRSDINKLRGEVEQKQQAIAADEKAISDLENQLRREGGEPGWLRFGREAEAQTKSEGPLEQRPGGQRGTREYWQRRFRSARETLARAQEDQRLVEDELNLLQIQQARELNTDAAAEFEARIAAKKAEVQVQTAATAKAQEALDNLENEFAASGAPEEWTKTE